MNQYAIAALELSAGQEVAAGQDGPHRKIVFESESFENFDNRWKARETYEVVSADEFVEIFELAPPGGPFEVYSRTRFVRAGR